MPKPKRCGNTGEVCRKPEIGLRSSTFQTKEWIEKARERYARKQQKRSEQFEARRAGVSKGEKVESVDNQIESLYAQLKEAKTDRERDNIRQVIEILKK